MGNRKCLHFEKGDSAQCPDHNEQTLAALRISLLEGKSLRALCCGLTDPGATERATTRLPTVFDHFYCKLERPYDKKSAQPMRWRNVAISWAETDELFIEIYQAFAPLVSHLQPRIIRLPSTPRLQPRLPTATLAHALPKQTRRLSQPGRRVIPID